MNYQSFVESYNDPSTRNNSEADASVIAEGNTYHGIVGNNNPVDWYKLTLKGNTKVQLYIRNYAGYESGIYFYDSNGKTVFSLCSTNGTVSKVLPAGSYSIYAERYNWKYNDWGIGSYQIAIGDSEDVNDNAAALIKSKPTITVKRGGKATFKWKKASDVTGYQIQVSNKKNFKGITKTYTVKNATKKTVSLPKKLRGKKIYVRIRAFSENEGSKTFSKWNKTVSKKSIK